MRDELAEAPAEEQCIGRRQVKIVSLPFVLAFNDQTPPKNAVRNEPAEGPAEARYYQRRQVRAFPLLSF